MMSPVWLAMTASPIASQLIVDVVSEAVQAVAEAMVHAMSRNCENRLSIDVKVPLRKVGMDSMLEATLVAPYPPLRFFQACVARLCAAPQRVLFLHSMASSLWMPAGLSDALGVWY